ncbi:MAG: HIT domain-containing protein [Candidatus Omnitrophica bacterium]|nr:HIT domain-containing protein [Candidatus Omnitrophota bacterium]
MDRLWAPWRIGYIKQNKQNKKCIFCQSIKNPKKGYVIFKTKYSLAILNIFPYNNGHVILSPIRHINKPSQLKKVEFIDLFKSLNKLTRLIDKVLKPDGYNIGINISKVAGAGIAGHLHIHIVPRWLGDTNFMPVIYETKVISQSLDELYRQLKNAKSKDD